MGCAIQMRAEAHTFFCHLAQLAQAEYLEAAGIGEQRPVPAHKLVQPAQLPHQLVPRPQIKMVGIAQNDLRAQFLNQVNVLRNGFHRPSRADGHESRRFHITVSGVDAGLTGRAGLGLDCEGKSHKDLWYRLFLKFRAERDSLFAR